MKHIYNLLRNHEEYNMYQFLFGSIGFLVEVEAHSEFLILNRRDISPRSVERPMDLSC
jgi:hypothetical protein